MADSSKTLLDCDHPTYRIDFVVPYFHFSTEPFTATNHEEVNSIVLAMRDKHPLASIIPYTTGCIITPHSSEMLVIRNIKGRDWTFFDVLWSSLNQGVISDEAKEVQNAYELDTRIEQDERFGKTLTSPDEVRHWAAIFETCLPFSDGCSYPMYFSSMKQIPIGIFSSDICLPSSDKVIFTVLEVYAPFAEWPTKRKPLDGAIIVNITWDASTPNGLGTDSIDFISNVSVSKAMFDEMQPILEEFLSRSKGITCSITWKQ